MTIEADILTTLNAHAGLSALVSSRNYSINLPQNPIYPNTVFSQASSNPVNNLSGRSVLHNIRMQFDIRAQTVLEMTNVKTQLIAAIESATLFKVVFLTDNPLPKEIRTETYRSSIDFSIWFNQT